METPSQEATAPEAQSELPKADLRLAQRVTEPDETLGLATHGLTSGWWAFANIFGLLVAGRTVWLTDRNLYLCRTPRLKVVAKYPRGSVSVRMDGAKLWIGDEHRISILGNRRDRSAARKIVDECTAPANTEG